MSSREVLSIHIGQAGVQMGAAAWDLYCLEHGVGDDGSLVEDQLPPTAASKVKRVSEDSGIADVHAPVLSDPCQTFFADNSAGKLTPRALFVDLEPSVVDVVRLGDKRRLFHPDQLISGKEDASNNFARGHYSVGRTISDAVEDRLRRMAERCDGLQGFIITNSAGGGTGSGFASRLLNSMDSDYTKATQLQVCVQPSPHLSSSVVEPYNAVLHHGHTGGTGRHRNGCCFLVQNEALYRVANKQLDIEQPSYSHVNAILAQVSSSLTSSLRFQGALNVDLCEFQTNLVPYPSLRYPLTSLAPLMSVEKSFYEQPTVATITRQCIEKEQQLACCDPAHGKYMSCCLLYRGDVTPADVGAAMHTVKTMKSVDFVDWCPTGFKVGINNVSPVVTADSFMSKSTRSACMLYNSSAISRMWDSTVRQFQSLLHKRAFVHWFVGEGMEEGEFTEAFDNILAMQKDYEEAAADSVTRAVDDEEEY